MLITLCSALCAPHARADTGGPLADLVDAAARRLAVAEPVAAFKFTTHGAVEDPARVRQQLAALGADATARHLGADYVTRIFTDQIGATEAIEYSLVAQWTLHPDSAPTQAPDLSASRSAIDALNQEMLTQVAADWDLLHSPECAAQLETARTDAGRRLDDLYQRALSLATQSYCHR